MTVGPRNLDCYRVRDGGFDDGGLEVADQVQLQWGHPSAAPYSKGQTRSIIERSPDGANWEEAGTLDGSSGGFERWNWSAIFFVPASRTFHYRVRYAIWPGTNHTGSPSYYTDYSNTIVSEGRSKGEVTFRLRAHWPVAKSTVLSSVDGGNTWNQIVMPVLPTNSSGPYPDGWFGTPVAASTAVADPEGWLVGGYRLVAVELYPGGWSGQTRSWVGRLKDGEWTLSYPFGDAVGTVGTMAYSPTLGRWIINGAWSGDGVNWTTGGAGGFTTIRWGGGQFVAVGDAGGGNGGAWTSSDGLSWQARSLPGYAGIPTDLQWNGSTWITGGYGNGFWTSPNGATWTKRDYPVGYFGGAVHYFAYSPELDRWITTSHGGRKTLYSDDNGVTWIETPNSSSWDERVVWSSISMQFLGLLANEDRQLTSSSDGINWAVRSDGLSDGLPWGDLDLRAMVPESVAYGIVASGGEVLVLGYGGSFVEQQTFSARAAVGVRSQEIRLRAREDA